MPNHLLYAPLQKVPANFLNALQELISALGSQAAPVRVKEGDPTKLQIIAGTGNDQVGMTIEGDFRYRTSTIEVAGSGAERTVDVWVTGSANVFTPGSPGEIDTTVYAFGLVVAEVGTPPTGTAIKRRVAQAEWNGAEFTKVTPIIGGVPYDQAAFDIPVVTSLPSTGSFVEFEAGVVSGVPQRWLLRRDTDLGLWLPAGADTAPMRSYAAGPLTVTTGNTPQNITGRPLLTVPADGRYRIGVGAYYENSGAPYSSGRGIAIGFQVNGSVPGTLNRTNSLWLGNNWTGGGAGGIQLENEREIWRYDLTLNEGDTVAPVFLADSPGAFQAVSITLRPISLDVP